ncbi:MAG TPA: tRNA (adenosine(37)-N6)-threonylcarbamoyltransferase complex dimerization subunit type 1 TsaB, partial [Rubrobacteraceae bacterium]|nr:tRNA (adenosine(37)-N6)-threonylcarbamoyltransferase complex dimerization subunit type 1 TsaB [Rubrobacteraceae bacterium]
MLILALDASTPTIAVGLARTEGRSGDEPRAMLAEVSNAARGASEALLPAVHDVLQLAGEDLASVDLILTGTGPGTFTGIRIAATTARALSLGTGAALSANSTLAALAAPLLPIAGDVLAVIDARRGQVFAQRFTDGDPAW